MSGDPCSDFGSNIYLARTMITSLRSPQDRQKVLRWLRKLTMNGRTPENKKIATDMLYALISNLEKGQLSPPFSSYPPTGSLQALSQLLINKGETIFSGNIDPTRGEWADCKAKASSAQPILYKISPDGGAFLSSQPVPSQGIFCYMAVVWSPKKDTV